MGLKLLIEHAWSQPVVFDPNRGFNVVVAAHVGGALVRLRLLFTFSLQRLRFQALTTSNLKTIRLRPQNPRGVSATCS
jgi:hypothetical protein